jgi:hypothetical protein
MFASILQHEREPRLLTTFNTSNRLKPHSQNTKRKFQKKMAFSDTSDDREACCRSSSICGSFFAMIWCINMLVSAITSLSWIDSPVDDWVSADALIIGMSRANKTLERNQTNFDQNETNQTIFDNDDTVSDYENYCAELNFVTEDGESITTVIDTYCSYESEDIEIGSWLAIMYNPADPEETFELELYEEELHLDGKDSLRLTVGVTVFFSIAYLACSIYLCKSQPELSPTGLWPSTTADTESPTGEPRESSEERMVRILSKFHFQDVLEGLSNTNATSIRAEDKHDPETLKIEGGGEDAIGKSDDQESSWSLAGATNMLSSWRKPSRDDECCICMETYNPGETVCVAKTTECDHVFHKDCISSWLQKNHDCCPLCRIDLMQ